MTLDHLVLSGEPYDRGHHHGERFAAEIAANVERYFDKLKHYDIGEETALDMATRFIPLIEDTDPTYAEEIHGIADGSDRPLDEIALLNARYEVTYGAYANAASANDADTPEADAKSGGDLQPDGCTSFGLQGEVTTNNCPYVGQNWDWIPDIDVFVMEVHQTDAPDHIALTEAGIAGGKIGVNEYGVALALNGLVTSADGEHPFRMPYHVRFRNVLNATRLSEAVGAVISTNRACSANVLLGSEAGELLNLEVLPEAINYVYPDDGVLTHANHLEKPANVESQFEQLLPDTICRAPRLRRLLQMDAGDHSPATLGNALRDHFDHPTSICRHPNPDVPEYERSITRVSAIIDIAEQRVHFTDGPPCESEYREYSLS